MSGDSEGYQPIPHEVIDRLDRQVGKGISRPVYNTGSGGGSSRTYRPSEPRYVPSTPDTSSTDTGQGETNDLLKELLEKTDQTNTLMQALIARLSTTDTSSSGKVEEKLDALTDAITLLALPESERTRILEERRREQKATQLKKEIAAAETEAYEEDKERTKKEREQLLQLAKNSIAYWHDNRRREYAISGEIAALIGDMSTAKKELEAWQAKKGMRTELSALIGDIALAQESINYYQKQGDHSLAGLIAAIIGDIPTAQKGIEASYMSEKGKIAALIGDQETAIKCMRYFMENGDNAGMHPYAEQISTIAAIIGNTQKARDGIEYCHHDYEFEGSIGVIAAWLIWADDHREMLNERRRNFEQRNNS